MSYGGEREAARLRSTLPPLSEEDSATLRRIRLDGKRHPDGCLDVSVLRGHANHLKDDAFSDEELVAVLDEIQDRGR